MIGELVQRYAATILLATPTFLQLYLRRCTPAQFGSLRLVLAGAEKLSESAGDCFRGHVRHSPDGGIWLTECAPVVAVNTFDCREPGFFQPGSRRGYVGQPAAGRRGADRPDRDLRAARSRHGGADPGQGPQRDARATWAATT